MADLLARVVDDRGDDIAGGDVLSPNHHVAERLGPGGFHARRQAFLDPGQMLEPAQARARGLERQPPGKRPAFSQEGCLLIERMRLAAKGLSILGVARVRRQARQRHLLAAGSKAAVEHAHLAQPRDRRLIVRPVIRLAQHRRLPVDAEPGQVLIDRRLELGPAAGEVGVLDPQHEPPACVPRRAMRDQRRIGMALVQIAGGGGGKAGGEHGGQVSSSSEIQSRAPCRIRTISTRSPTL